MFFVNSLFDIFVLLTLIYILSLLYYHKDEIMKKIESFQNIQPKHLEETDNRINEDVTKYTRYMNPLTSNMFQNNDFYTTKNTQEQHCRL